VNGATRSAAAPNARRHHGRSTPARARSCPASFPCERYAALEHRNEWALVKDEDVPFVYFQPDCVDVVSRLVAVPVAPHGNEMLRARAVEHPQYAGWDVMENQPTGRSRGPRPS
jgi:hypothetical protein